MLNCAIWVSVEYYISDLSIVDSPSHVQTNELFNSFISEDVYYFIQFYTTIFGGDTSLK